MTVDIFWLCVSGTLMAKKRSTLGLCKDSVLVNQFDDPLLVKKDNTTSVKQWTCEDIAKWVIENGGMPDNMGATFWENNVNRAALLSMQNENFKDDGVSKVDY